MVFIQIMIIGETYFILILYEERNTLKETKKI